MASEQTTLACVGCECAAPAGAMPDPLGYWLCRSCTDGMKWAMRWTEAIYGKR